MKAQSRKNTNATVRRKVEKARVYMYKTQSRKSSYLQLKGVKSVKIELATGARIPYIFYIGVCVSRLARVCRVGLSVAHPHLPLPCQMRKSKKERNVK